ncbi:MAG: sulfatase-like hydrolase/transferase [Planctomycetota bacterium]|nr:sulfatase-like hydrolase/transferase [Planctomycetota bacterium]
MSEKRPNLLLIVTDQQRADTIAALGNPVIRTPNLDRLAREGTAFTRAYTPSPVCVAARCSLHYGQYPSRTGCYDNGFPMPTDRPSLADALQAAGYRTHAIGKCHFTPDRHALRGFASRQTQEELVADPERDDYLRELRGGGFAHLTDPHGVRGEMYYVPQPAQMPARLHPTQWIGDQAERFIRGTGGAGATRPWMLQADFIHPHPPFAPPAPWHKLYRGPNMPLPMIPPDAERLWLHINRVQNFYKYRNRGLDLNLVRQMKAYYYACISFIDLQIGRMLRALESTGQLDRTLVVFTSDHGELLGDYGLFGKRSPHAAAARVPLLARLPGAFAPGGRCAEPASLVDIAPTFVGLAQGEVSRGFEGVDLSRLAKGEAPREAVFIQFQRAGEAIYAAIDARWKYVFSAPDARAWLFDREGDPQETRNMVDAPEGRLEAARLKAALIGHLRRAGDDAALDGDDWRAWPVQKMPEDLDARLIYQDHSWADQKIPGYTDA